MAKKEGKKPQNKSNKPGWKNKTKASKPKATKQKKIDPASIKLLVPLKQKLISGEPATLSKGLSGSIDNHGIFTKSKGVIGFIHVYECDKCGAANVHVSDAENHNSEYNNKPHLFVGGHYECGKLQHVATFVNLKLVRINRSSSLN